jgi:uncharacterized RDD family membrane protein YckC
MQWYYADAGRQVGPLEDAAFEELVRTGVVRDDTPIWREGLADWVPYSTVRPARPVSPVQPAPPPPAAAPIPAAAPVEATGFCTQCGGRFPAVQLAMVGNRQMCPACRQPVAPVAPATPAQAAPVETGFCTQCGGRFPTTQLSMVGNRQVCGGCRAASSPQPASPQPQPSSPQPAQPQPGPAGPAWSAPGAAIPAAQPLTQFATPVAGDYATWATRAIGYIIDQLLVGIAVGILGGIAVMLFGSMIGLGSLGSAASGDALGAISGGLGGSFCCFLLVLIPAASLGVGIYNRVYLVSKRGFSIGQGVMKIKIIDAQGNKLTTGTAFIRLLAQVGLSLVPFGNFLDLLWPLWDAQRQTLHDKAVGSFAVNNPSGQ